MYNQNCCCSVAKLCLTRWDPVDCSIPGFPVVHRVLEFAQVHVHQVSDITWSSHPLLPSSPFVFSLSQNQVFSSESVLHIRWLKNWSLSISPSNEYWRLVFFRIDWFDLLQSKGLSKVLSNTIAQKHQFISAFFMVQHSHLSMTKGKIIAFTIQTFIGKVMSQLFNILSRGS